MFLGFTALDLTKTGCLYKVNKLMLEEGKNVATDSGYAL